MNQQDKEILKGEIEAKLAGKLGEVITKGGRRPGAGRPRGSKNRLTKSVRSRERTLRERVLKKLDQLVNAQLSLAEGVQYLYEIKMRNVGGRRKPQHILVTDPKKIKAYLDGDYEEDKYVYITAERPDNKAIEALLDRAFGKATTNQNTDHNFNVNIMQYEQITAEKRDLLGDNDSIPVLSEGLSARTDVESEEIQDSSVAPKIWQIEDSSEQPDTKSTK